MEALQNSNNKNSGGVGKNTKIEEERKNEYIRRKRKTLKIS